MRKRDTSLNSANSAEDTVTMANRKDAVPMHDAARNNEAVARVIGEAMNAGVADAKARVRLSDIAEKLEVEYIRPTELAALGPFNIIDAHVREKRGEFGVQCEYECVILSGEQAGASAFLTLNESPTRRKLVEMVERYRSVGPVLLRPVGKEIRGNQPWGFVEPGSPEAEGVVTGGVALGVGDGPAVK